MWSFLNPTVDQTLSALYCLGTILYFFCWKQVDASELETFQSYPSNSLASPQFHLFFIQCKETNRTWLGSMRMWVQSLALLSGLRIWRGHELWSRSQVQLRSWVAVAVVQTSSYSSDSTLSLRTSLCHGCSPKKPKKKRSSRRGAVVNESD